MSFRKLSLFVITISLFLACNNKKSESVVVETWENGNPKRTAEYIINDDGSKSLYKETMFFKEKQKFIEGTYNKQQQRDGKWTSWFEDGKQNSQGTYVDGKEQGKYTVWFPNSQIHYTGKYNKGVKTGKWKFYNEEGKLVKEVVF